MSEAGRVQTGSITSRLKSPLLAVGVRHWELLIVCLLLLTVYAVREAGALPGDTVRLIDIFLVAATLGLALHAAPVRRRTQVVLTFVAAISIALGVVGVVTHSVSVQRLAIGVSAVMLAAAFLFVLKVVLTQKHVTADTLFGAFAAYLAVALIFAMIYSVIARTDPGAFEPPQNDLDGETDLYYFSFVTLTSLGYGDIAPASDLTRVLAPIEAVLGAILIAGLAGRIVGLLVAQASGNVTLEQLERLIRDVKASETDGADVGGRRSSGARRGGEP